MQGDEQRLDEATTRGRRTLTAWLEKEPFGVPPYRAATLAAREPNWAAQRMLNRRFDRMSPDMFHDIDVECDNRTGQVFGEVVQR